MRNQKRRVSEDFPIFSELDLIDGFVVDAVILKQFSLPNAVQTFIVVPSTLWYCIKGKRQKT